MLLRARIVLPVSQPPIENGAVLIADGRIVKVGAWPDLSASSSEEAVDLGDVILLPGLVNAHCHLDYTEMAGLLSRPKYFSDWIKGILALKANWSYSEYGKSWMTGSDMLLRTGTTTVADIEAVPELLSEVWQGTPLRLFSFLEMTSVNSKRDAASIIDEALGVIAGLPQVSKSAGFSPHALYSTTPQLMRRTAAIARENKIRVTSHVAESREEFEMFTQQTGPLYDWLKTQRDMSDCTGNSPVQQLALLEMLGENFLAVHVNYLAEGDADLLARNNVSVVHCPRSHAYFEHKPFPAKDLQQAGVNLCLGTDSLASMKKERGAKLELNMFSEMQSFAKNAPHFNAEQIVRMATLNGARALGLEKSVGEISEQAFADLIAIPFNANISEVYDGVVQFSGNVSASMIDGAWALPPAT
ncbi:MAG: Amidohydrolase [Verrucomicrobiales bacterium]|nr:Amidohydrolase [Verrucomicrobiales bacterium]